MAKREMIPGTKIPKPKVQLVGQNGNAFFVLGKVRRALKDANVPAEVLEAFYKKATESDYDHLLVVAGEYVDIK